MSIPTYAMADNLPAPTTNSALQTFTDVYGEVWIAKSTVGGGNWYRARDTLRAKITNNAQVSTPTTGTLFPLPNVTKDVWGMFNSAQSALTALIPGWYRADFWMWNGGSATLPFYSQYSLMVNNASTISSDNYFDGSAVSNGNRTSALFFYNAGDYVNAHGYTSSASTSHSGYASVCLQMDYLGTG